MPDFEYLIAEREPDEARPVEHRDARPRAKRVTPLERAQERIAHAQTALDAGIVALHRARDRRADAQHQLDLTATAERTAATAVERLTAQLTEAMQARTALIVEAVQP